jgi:DNA polymerase III subunit epsilon
VCQIGAVVFIDGNVHHTWETLVNPNDYFDERNVALHGITPEQVAEAKTFPEVFGALADLIAGQIVLHHCSFDRIAFSRSIELHELDDVACQWLDGARVVRRAWPEYSKSGYGLNSIARVLGIKFKHHSALEDARAVGEILLNAIRHTQIELDQWLKRVHLPINPSDRRSSTSTSKCARPGDPAGALHGETIVFTGKLLMIREQAAELAAKAGCDVADNVTKATTLLVVGDQDIRVLAGHPKSSKHRKAEELISKGQALRILTETDFLQVMKLERDLMV